MPDTSAQPAVRRPLDVAYAVAIPVLAVASPVVALVLVWAAFGLVFHLAGGTLPTGSDQQLAGRLALVACAVAVGGPLLGFVLGVRAQSRGSIWTFVVMGTVGLAFAAVVAVGFGLPVLHAADPPPQPTSTRSVCQELSGGDNRCPGG